jgi:hypothetical protein
MWALRKSGVIRGDGADLARMASMRGEAGRRMAGKLLRRNPRCGRWPSRGVMFHKIIHETARWSVGDSPGCDLVSAALIRASRALDDWRWADTIGGHHFFVREFHMERPPSAKLGWC